MRNSWRFTKDRENIKQRFLRELQQQKQSDSDKSKIWYRQRHNFFPLLMIFAFAVMLLIVKAVYNIQFSENLPQNVQQEELEEEKMDYEKAVEIFEG